MQHGRHLDRPRKAAEAGRAGHGLERAVAFFLGKAEAGLGVAALAAWLPIRKLMEAREKPAALPADSAGAIRLCIRPRPRADGCEAACSISQSSSPPWTQQCLA